jgi:hypothetical protein
LSDSLSRQSPPAAAVDADPLLLQILETHVDRQLAGGLILRFGWDIPKPPP